jgi:hypothetical protein
VCFRIGKATGYKLSELSGLVEGSTLVIGGKQIEVMDVVSEENWKNGTCFTGALAAPNNSVSVVEQPLALRKPFAVPSLSGQTMKLTTTVSSSLHRLVQCTVVTRKLKTVVCVCVCLHSLKLYSHYMTQVSEAALSCQDLQHSISWSTTSVDWP